MDLGLLILRLVFGLTLAAHSAQKLFGWFGGPGIAGTAQMMEQLGFRPARLQAVVAGLVEGGAGLGLAAGLLTPLAVAAFISVMFVATASVHLPKGFFNQNGGFEYTLALATGALAVAFTGPGVISADAALGIDWSGFFWGVAALALGLAGGGLQLMARRGSPVPEASDHQRG
jgi:putative oxidoreductase